MPTPRHRPKWILSTRTLALLVASALIALSAAIATATADARPSFRGVQVHSLWSDSTSADMDRELDLAAQAGSNVVRADVGWASLEDQAPGQINSWYRDRLDRFVNGASARGMKVVATLWSTPCWASSAPESEKQQCAPGWWGRHVVQYAPSNPADYARIAQWMTSRYGPKLAALELWNEPNLADGSFWRSGPGAYASLVRAAYPAAKAGNASVPVLAGALSGSDSTYLASLYASGMKGSYDGLSVHPYADRGFVKMTGFRAVEQAAGDSAPVWATEFGYPTGSDPAWNVSPDDQARFIKRDFADLDRLDWVGGAIVYNLRDKGTNAGQMQDNFGLVRRDYSPKPGYAALREALGGAPALTVSTLNLRVLRRGRMVYATGTAPRRATVGLKLSQCQRIRSRTLKVKARSGRFSRKLGDRVRVAGCTLTAKLVRSRAMAARVRVR